MRDWAVLAKLSLGNQVSEQELVFEKILGMPGWVSWFNVFLKLRS